jgi:glycosyltransferase involved in cell wall biosynthesis
MDTGGTRDVVVHGQTGLLSMTPAGLGADLAELVADAALRDRLGAGARAHVEARFSAPAVVDRIAALYRSLVDARGRRG